MISWLDRRFLRNSDGHLRDVAFGAALALTLKVVAAGASFAFSVVLARLLGVQDAGLFFLALTIVTCLSVVARLGFDYSMLRNISALSASADWSGVSATYRTGVTVCAVTSAVTSVAMAAGGDWLAEHVFQKPALGAPLSIMGWSVLPISLYSLHSQALQGLKKVADSVTILNLWTPLAALILIAPLTSVAGLGLRGAAWGYVAACGFCLCIGVWRWAVAMPRPAAGPRAVPWRQLIWDSRATFAVSLLNLALLWMPVILLGAWGTAADVALFSAAQRTAMLVSLILIAINSITAPKFAALAAQRDVAALSRVARASANLATCAALPLLLVCLLIPRQVMSLFGRDFAGADQLLMWLAIGQFVNVAKGSAGHLLMMTGNDRAFRNNLFACSVTAAALYAFVIPRYGAAGAAWVTTGVACLQNLISTVIVQRSLGFSVVSWRGNSPRTTPAPFVESVAAKVE